MIESCTRILIHLIDQIHRCTYTWEDNPLRINIRLVIRVIQDIRTRTANRHLIDDTTTQFFVELIYLRSNISYISLTHQLLIALDIGCKEGAEIRDTIDSTRLAILEKQELIQQITRLIIQGSS